ncbi:MAG: threonyl-tRNA synthetase editing domain-containing protein [Deltaproteobacteria bacterium]|nr:threonyl-tRNA synthetase editing domain-containing protein [Deltaproteobacteria bacterium]
MKILMFYTPEFWFKTFEKKLPDVPDKYVERIVANAVVVFYQCESEDEDRFKTVLSKAVKNIKWLTRKFNTDTVVLHSFSHLSTSKATTEFTVSLIDHIRQKLKNVDYTIHETPFGYLNEWKMHVAGESLAKVFKDI